MVKDPNYTKFKGIMDDLARQHLLFLTNKRVKQHRKKKRFPIHGNLRW